MAPVRSGEANVATLLTTGTDCDVLPVSNVTVVTPFGTRKVICIESPTPDVVSPSPSAAAFAGVPEELPPPPSLSSIQTHTSPLPSCETRTRKSLPSRATTPLGL